MRSRSDAMERRLTMTVEQAAEILGISRTSAYRCATRGEIPTRRLFRSCTRAHYAAPGDARRQT
ncbi:MAG: helix-turn-helix domain-containing protein [Actinomycetota bacterium]